MKHCTICGHQAEPDGQLQCSCDGSDSLDGLVRFNNVLDRMRCVYCGKHLNFVRNMARGHSIIDGYVHENREDKLACFKARAEANDNHEA